jgi:hypothetical protein
VSTTADTAPSGIVLDEVVARRINNALADGKTVAVSYVDSEGRPHLSLRGSVQVFSPDQLAIWVRKPEGGLVEGVSKNPYLAFLYRNPDERTTYTFTGTGRIDEDEGVRRAVYDASPEPERIHDPELKGVAVVVDLDRAQGFTIGGDRFDMRRVGS